MDIAHTNFLLEDLSKDITLYSEVFDPEDSVSALNKCNGAVFSRLQLCLSERIFLSFARLMDPAESFSKRRKVENLSIENLIEKYSLESDYSISTKFSEIKAMYDTTNIDEYRNKLLGHNDKNVKLGFSQVDIVITSKFAHKMLTFMKILLKEIAIKTDYPLAQKNPDSYDPAMRDECIGFLNKVKIINS